MAIAIAYSVMNQPNPLGAALPLIHGYHQNFPLQEDELACLYNAIAMRLIISVTKSAINKIKEPDNTYLLISEKPAWEVLKLWFDIDASFAHCQFRSACNFEAHPKESLFENWSKNNQVSLHSMFPTLVFDGLTPVDMSIGSELLGNAAEYNNLTLSKFKLDVFQEKNYETILHGGYLEARPFYCTKAFQREGNQGIEYRTVHLGQDFWIPELTPIHAPFAGKVISISNNNIVKDYGPTIIIEHKISDDLTFYSLFGHLSTSSLSMLEEGQEIEQGSLIGYVGNSKENGQWVPHLHFQLTLDLLGNTTNFPGVSYPKETTTLSSICPNPLKLFKEYFIEENQDINNDDLISYRKEHLGKSLSLSYDIPLKIVRGEGAYLIDQFGQKYLDTVNNVAHVGHEHPRVVKAGQQQMSVLNTNSRYLHDNINEFAQELLATLPKELSVLHFVNSGSEANELAMRMAQATTGSNKMIALEVGYHGNTGGCIGISSYKFDSKGGQGAPAHTHIVPLPDSYRGIYRGNHTGSQYANHVATEIEKIHNEGNKVGAFIAEPIVSCGGQIELPENYLKEAYQHVRKAGGVCISDEVQVGFGRVGKKFWGFELQGVTPDIVVMGKPIGNGHPLAAVACTPEIAEKFANGMEYFNTFGGNPVSCANR